MSYKDGKWIFKCVFFEYSGDIVPPRDVTNHEHILCINYMYICTQKEYKRHGGEHSRREMRIKIVRNLLF